MLVKHIIQFSGGKDSTAMLLMMIEKGMQVDEIIFCDTGKEFPEMYEHIKKVEEYIGRKITFLEAEKPFDYYFSEHVKTRGKDKENQNKKGYGWPRMWVRWCTRLLKQKLTRDYLKSQGEYIQYIGIAADEPKRHKNIPKNTVHPLFDWGITEEEALQYCYDRGFNWGGLYKQFRRVSCWCCPLQGIDELRNLRKFHPDLFKKLLDMDTKVTFKFRPDYSVEQLEQRFNIEDQEGKIYKRFPKSKFKGDYK